MRAGCARQRQRGRVGTRNRRDWGLFRSQDLRQERTTITKG